MGKPTPKWINPNTGKDDRDSPHQSVRRAAWASYWAEQDSGVTVRYYVIWGKEGYRDVVCGPYLLVPRFTPEDNKAMGQMGYRPLYRVNLRARTL